MLVEAEVVQHHPFAQFGSLIKLDGDFFWEDPIGVKNFCLFTEVLFRNQERSKRDSIAVLVVEVLVVLFKSGMNRCAEVKRDLRCKGFVVSTDLGREVPPLPTTLEYASVRSANDELLSAATIRHVPPPWIYYTL